MSQHIAQIRWRRTSESFDYENYNREHRWLFSGGSVVAASAAPEFRGDERFVDPEEAFVASVSACHMLTFLAICARKRLVVDQYEDDAVGVLEKNEQGRLAVTRIELAPRITFAGQVPNGSDLVAIHERAHSECFIANSIRTEVVVTRVS